jgi:hypothetical protein
MPEDPENQRVALKTGGFGGLIQILASASVLTAV